MDGTYQVLARIFCTVVKRLDMSIALLYEGLCSTLPHFSTNMASTGH